MVLYIYIYNIVARESRNAVTAILVRQNELEEDVRADAEQAADEEGGVIMTDDDTPPLNDDDMSQ